MQPKVTPWGAIPHGSLEQGEAEPVDDKQGEAEPAVGGAVSEEEQNMQGEAEPAVGAEEQNSGTTTTHT